jgi:hypothetical protein
MRNLDLIVLNNGRAFLTREQFLSETPAGSIALDGAVRGGPFFDEKTVHLNLDHHDAVYRPSTMSTAKQAYFHVKGEFMERLKQLHEQVPVYVNDCDQDVCLATWILDHYRELSGTKSVPLLNRLLDLNDKLDVTGGAFPMDLREQLVRQHNWVFTPYNVLVGSEVRL